MTITKPNNMDEYIAGFPKDTQEILEQIRAIIKKAAPEAEEAISYAIPILTFKGRYLVYFAAYKNHIGFYPEITANEKLFSKPNLPDYL